MPTKPKKPATLLSDEKRLKRTAAKRQLAVCHKTGVTQVFFESPGRP
jgi:hypothetical protein